MTNNQDMPEHIWALPFPYEEWRDSKEQADYISTVRRICRRTVKYTRSDILDKEREAMKAKLEAAALLADNVRKIILGINASLYGDIGFVMTCGNAQGTYLALKQALAAYEGVEK